MAISLLEKAGYTGVDSPPAAPAPATPAEPAKPATPAEPAPAGASFTPATPPAEPAPTTPAAQPAAPAAAPATPAPAPLEGFMQGKFKSLAEVEAHINDLTSKANNDPFVNDYVRSMNDALKNGIDLKVFQEVSQIEVDKLEPKEALILQYMMKDKLTREEAETYVNSTYHLDDEGVDVNDPAVKRARIQAKVDANGAKEYLASHKADALTPPKEKVIEKVQAAWDPVMPKVMEGFKTLEFTGKAGKYNFPVSDQAREQGMNALKGVIGTGMFNLSPTDSDGMKVANKIVMDAIIAHDLPSMLDSLAEAITGQHMKGLHNPRLAGNPPAATPGAADEETRQAQFLANNMGLKISV